MLDQFLSLNIFAVGLIFTRVGAALSFMPGFGAAFINVRAKLGLALVVSVTLAPVLVPVIPSPPAGIGALAILFAREFLVGAFLGLIARILVAVLQVAGTVIAYVSSLANAFIQDPLVEQQSALVAGFLSTLGLVMIFVTDSHHLMLRAIADSYTLFDPAAALPIADMAEMLSRKLSDCFRLGVQLSAPLIISGLSYYIGIGLLGRLMPQLPVFFVGLPVQLSAQLAVLMISTSGILLVFMAWFTEGMSAFVKS